MRLRRLFQEPLVRFLAGGLAAYCVLGWTGAAIDPQSRTIILDQPQIERLAAAWQQAWQRPPTRTELDGLIRDYIKEEIYSREAIRMGFDRDDLVVRRRLSSKMEFLTNSQADSASVDDATLSAWMAQHPEIYGRAASKRLPAIRAQVEQEWRAATAQARHEQAYQALLRRYRVEIERP